MLNNVFVRNDIVHQKFLDYGFGLPDSCNYCNKQDILLKKCAKCTKTQYCSKNCQTSDWKLRHKTFCKLYCGTFEYEIDLQDCFSGHSSIRTFHPELQGIGKGPKPDISGRKKFLIKVQAGDENKFAGLKPSHPYDVTIYDRSLTVDGDTRSELLFTFVRQCGILCSSAMSCEKIYCWAKIRNNSFHDLTIYLDRVADPQKW